MVALARIEMPSLFESIDTTERMSRSAYQLVIEFQRISTTFDRIENADGSMPAEIEVEEMSSSRWYDHSFFSVAIPVCATVVICAWALYTTIGSNLSDVKKDSSERIQSLQASMERSFDKVDQKLDKIDDSLSEARSSLSKEIADLRVRQAQVEAKQ